MRFIRINDDVVFRSFGEETVLLNLSTGEYHGLKGSGSRMLEVLQQEQDVDAAAATVAAEYGHDAGEVAQDMRHMCEQLAERSLIEIEVDP